MKGNTKKLVVFAGVATIVMLMTVPTASANDFWWKALIHGEYAFTGSGACTLAPGGFNDKFAPNNTATTSMGPNFWEGTYTFNYGGKGKMDAKQRYQEGPPNYGSGVANLSWEFTYQMDGSVITFTFKPGTYSLEYIEGPNAGVVPKLPLGDQFPSQVTFDHPYTGRISPDGMDLYVFFGVPMKITIPEFGGLQLICQGVHQGFKTRW